MMGIKTNILLILLVISAQGQEEVCERNRVCSIVHNRFWLPNKHEKVCKCPGKPCPVVYSKDSNFLAVNTRSQMHFCEPLSSDLPPCDSSSISLSITQKILSNLRMQQQIELHCKCEGKKYWKYFSHMERHSEETQDRTITDNFQCVELKRCSAGQFCGFARTDYGFVYHRCSCPQHYRCMFDPGSLEVFDGVQELFYNGTAYEAHCRLAHDDDLW
ncbi:kappa-scoloptoxin(11)-Ss1a-like [Phlebotomus argentipes]|uniref:kappa-scoloptoxin(11)-Ss1a-like n=1 Tax=Phlebotomus argentipes TaxID=94469 RepID=UPI00289371B2|nr:kappa-scoloptoxin(11)-Ss1a-like [Phlebotomus argentipes]